MKRLFDADGAEPRCATAAELLRHVPALDEDPFRQRRVRARLASASPRRASWPARAAVAVVLVLAGGAAAHGIAQSRWSSASRTAPAWSPSASPAVAPAAEKVLAPPAASLTSDTTPATAAAAPAAARVHEHRAPPAAPPPSVAAVQAPRDAGTELMVEAMQARRSGDLGRAARLLGDYRRRFPRGALAEEALALSVETAMLRGSELTPELARAYLARFPDGRYRSWVEGTLLAPR